MSNRALKKAFTASHLSKEVYLCLLASTRVDIFAPVLCGLIVSELPIKKLYRHFDLSDMFFN